MTHRTSAIVVGATPIAASLQTALNDAITEIEARGDELVTTRFSTVEVGGKIHYSALVLFRTQANISELEPVS